jgi:predicted permease
MSYWNLLLATLPMFALLATGWFVRQRGLLTHAADESLLRLVVNLLYPALVFQSVVSNPAASDPANLVAAPLLGFAAIALGFAVGAGAGLLGGLRDPVKLRTFVFAVGIFNYGYIPVPIVQDLFGAATLSVLFVFILGVELAIWTVGIAILAASGGLRSNWKRIVNPTVLALLAGLATNLAGLGSSLPAPLASVIAQLGACSIPLGLILVGATLADEARGRSSTPGRWRTHALASTVRLLLLPAIFITAAAQLELTPELRRVLVVQAAMPCGILPIVLAKHFRGDVPTALWTILGTTALGLFLIPFWIRFGLHLTGLLP